MANTPNFNLYKPDRADTTVDVDTSLTTNFTTIDTELKSNKDGLDTHKTDVNAHASDKITHADGSVKITLDNHETRIVAAETAIDGLDTRVGDLETNGTGGGAIPPDLENRLTTVESDVEGILAPATFDAMNQQSYTFDEYRIGYVNNKLGDVSQILLPGVSTAVGGINELVSQSTEHATQLAEIAYQNIKNFGAKENGETDVAIAIQQAEDLGVNIFIPDGVWIIKSRITKKNSNWVGQSHNAILLWDDSYTYVSDGTSNHAYAVKTQYYDTEDLTVFTEFTIENLTIKYRITQNKASIGHFDLFLIGNARNIVLRHLNLDSDSATNLPHSVIDFKKGTDRILFENNTGVHNASGSYGNTFMVRNFSLVRKTRNVVVRNNRLIKNHGGDEIIWVCADYNTITDITIEGNYLEGNASGSDTQASIIYVVQSDGAGGGAVSPDAYVDNISITNNTIKCKNVDFSMIEVGRASTYPQPTNVYIADNYIDSTSLYTSGNTSVFTYAIVLQSTVQNAVAENNYIKGNYYRVINGCKVVKHNQIVTDFCDRVIVACDHAENNVITITSGTSAGVCFDNVKNVIGNTVTSDANIIYNSKAHLFNILNNKFTMTSVSKVSYMINTWDGTSGDLEKMLFVLQGNIFNMPTGATTIINNQVTLNIYAEKNYIYSTSTLVNGTTNVKHLRNNLYNNSSIISYDTLVSGTTATRPTFNRYVGYPYFDTTLNKQIWWNGTVWVDATGTTV